MAYRISVDTGGTFTDVVVATEDGALHIGKALTSRERAFSGISSGLAPAAEELGVDPGELLADTEVLTYGTTRATNAIVEATTARTAFFTTAGFPDILLLREGGKPDPFGQIPFPKPYVPRHLTWELEERIDSEGDVFVPLDEASVSEAMAAAAAARCEAIAVCLLWATVNPAHELRVGELIQQELPSTPFTLSHQLNPVVREYRRASSTAIDASLKPLMQDYIEQLDADLRDAGFPGHLLIATSFGGSWRPDAIVEKPLYSVGSGPSMAPVAAVTYAEADLGSGDVIVCDTGGTTFDVGLISGGSINYTAETWLGGRWIGHITGLRSVDVKSIGAGGGSIAWIDTGGLLRVGPHSAGADPGPACYGRGGTAPTVTDAAVVLGYLEPEHFLGGRLTLDVDAARSVIEAIAAPLEMSIEEAASATVVVATENIVAAIREITIAQGIDPREVAIVAGGGASGLTVAQIARELGCGTVLVPRTAGALSACGAMYSDIVTEFSATHYAETRALPVGEINDVLEGLERQADGFLRDLADLAPTEVRKEFAVDARYRSQVWELPIDLPFSRLDSARGRADLEAAFHAEHERVFAVREDGQYLECLVWKCRARAVLASPPLHAREATKERRGEPESGRAYFRDTGFVDVPRYAGATLTEGTEIAGPAIVHEPTTTVVVYPGSTLRVTGLDNYVLDVDTTLPAAAERS
ncbi:MAG: hydantoinase/oxoprolinase family protein [Gaiellaceae bacterium]